MESSVLGAVIGAIGTLLAIAASLSKLKASWLKEIDDKIKSEVLNARTIAESDLKSVDLKLDALAKDISNLENKVDKDIEHVKTIYNSEIKQLAGKIEELREEVRHQHSQLVSLLTRLVSDK
jgi:peptidoglycan hydrolase CwlO-like protein